MKEHALFYCQSEARPKPLTPRRHLLRSVLPSRARLDVLTVRSLLRIPHRCVDARTCSSDRHSLLRVHARRHSQYRQRRCADARYRHADVSIGLINTIHAFATGSIVTGVFGIVASVGWGLELLGILWEYRSVRGLDQHELNRADPCASQGQGPHLRAGQVRGGHARPVRLLLPAQLADGAVAACALYEIEANVHLRSRPRGLHLFRLGLRLEPDDEGRWPSWLADRWRGRGRAHEGRRDGSSVRFGRLLLLAPFTDLGSAHVDAAPDALRMSQRRLVGSADGRGRCR